MFQADSESGGLLDSADAFSDKVIRLGFMRKVYSILSLQLLLTTAVAGLFYIEPIREYTQGNGYWLIWVAFVPSFICLIVMSCCEGVRRKSPGNMVCLGIFTLAEGFMMGIVVSTYSAKEVLIALGICVVVVFGLTIFALQTKIDFTAMGGALLVALLCLMMFGFFAAIFRGNNILNLVYASIGAFIFGLYIIFDTQMMMGGKHKYALDPEEYIFASLNLYLDIINLFLFILRIVGSSNNN